MGLDFIVEGVTLSKRKVEQKGLQHFINDNRYYNYIDEYRNVTQINERWFEGFKFSFNGSKRTL